MITSHELREKYLSFFESKCHTRIPSSSVLPENDPTALFIGSGMQPLVPYLGGATHPGGTRLVDVQKCIRTIDIDEVGDDTHLTFFEMLGNWSLGDYFKQESIAYSFEFLTSHNYLNIPLERLAFTCYQGNAALHVPKDEVSYNFWRSHGVMPERIAYLGDDDNWWPKMGMDGLCGPDTEIFYWVSDEPAPKVFDPNDSRWVEIWNNVFMEFRFCEGKLESLEHKNVDTGMGLERVLVVLNGKKHVYETDVFLEALECIRSLALPESQNDMRAQRIIADHLRAAVIMISDGVNPSNVDQGYVLRKLIRRAVRQGMRLGIHGHFTNKIAHIFVESLGGVYPAILKRSQEILVILTEEEIKFEKTLHAGTKEFQKQKEKLLSQNTTQISGDIAFHLYDTYGFPLEITKDLAQESEMTVDERAFEQAFEIHKAKSREGAQEKFAGGLADHSPETIRLHTANHLMLQAMKQVLGPHVEQRGSNITTERLRFDFSHEARLTDEQIYEIQSIVNQKIQEALPVWYEEMTVEEAMAKNATGVFVDKYTNDLGGKVKVYAMGDFSLEICGGPHVENTSELISFKIVKQEPVSAGVRRIKAVVGVL